MEIIIVKVRNGRSNCRTITQKEINKWAIRVGITAVILAQPHFASAATAADIATKVKKATVPIIDAIKAVANPICYGSGLWGFSRVMLGQKTEGVKQIRNAAWGYIGVQLAPLFMDVITVIGA